MLMSLHFLTNYKGIILVFLTTAVKKIPREPHPLSECVKIWEAGNFEIFDRPKLTSRKS